MDPPKEPERLGLFIMLKNVILAPARSPGHTRRLIWRQVPCDCSSTAKFGDRVFKGAKWPFPFGMVVIFDVHQTANSENDNARKRLLTGVSIINRGDSTPIELFLEGVRVWDIGIRRLLSTNAVSKG